MLSIEYLKKQLIDASAILLQVIENETELKIKDQLTEVENKLLVAIGICNSAQIQGPYTEDC